MKTQRRLTGDWGEAAVEKDLAGKGYKILARNYSTRLGELDLVARKKNLITFIEVKTRKQEYFHISQVITFSKQQKIIKAAKQFIQENDFEGCILRFDVAIVMVSLLGEPEITYIENAFCERLDRFF
jgi:putative endonuclease